MLPPVEKIHNVDRSKYSFSLFHWHDRLHYLGGRLKRAAEPGGIYENQFSAEQFKNPEQIRERMIELRLNFKKWIAGKRSRQRKVFESFWTQWRHDLGLSMDPGSPASLPPEVFNKPRKTGHAFEIKDLEILIEKNKRLYEEFINFLKKQHALLNNG